MSRQFRTDAIQNLITEDKVARWRQHGAARNMVCGTGETAVVPAKIADYVVFSTLCTLPLEI